MTDYADYETILAVIETGINVARRNPKPGEPGASPDYTRLVRRCRGKASWSRTRSDL
jgi:hypothetical protein